MQAAADTNRERDAVARPYLDERELAERWGVSVRTLQDWRWRGTGPRFTKLGALVRYAVSDIEAYEEAGRGAA